MANVFGDVPSNLSFSSGQLLRWNGSAWEAFTPTSGITIGSTAISSGTNNRVLFQSGGVVSQSANLTYDGSEFKVGNGSNTTFHTNTGYAQGVYVLDGDLPSYLPHPNFLFSVAGNASDYVGLDFNARTGGAVPFICLRRADVQKWSITVDSADEMNFRAGNVVATQVLTLLANGKVGIGNSAPSEKLHLTGNFQITDGGNIICGTSTGTKIGTGSTEKIAFWGGTPVTQRTIFGGITDATGGTSGTTINIDDGMGGIDVSALNDALATIINRLNATRNILLDVGIAA